MRILFIEDNFLYNSGIEKSLESPKRKFPESMKILKDGIYWISDDGKDYLKLPVDGKVCRNYEEATIELENAADSYDHVVVDLSFPGSDEARDELNHLSGRDFSSDYGPFGLLIFQRLMNQNKKNVTLFTTDYGHAKEAFEVLRSLQPQQAQEIDNVVHEFLSRYGTGSSWKNTDDIIGSSNVMIGAKLRKGAWLSLINKINKD